MKECDHPKQIVCGVEMCGTCYYNELMSSKDRARISKLEDVYDEYKHMIVTRKAKGV